MKKGIFWLLISICIIVFFVFKYKEELLQKYIRYEKNAEIVMFGDSHMAHGKWNTTLQRKPVLNYGWPGYTSKMLVDKIDEITIYKPKSVFILCGGNDIFYEDFSLDATLSNQINIASTLKQHKIEPIFLELMHQRNNTCFNKTIDTINLNLRAYGQKAQIEVINVNRKMYDSLGLKANLTDDGLHLNSKGYLVLSEGINQFLKNRFE